ncbi:MAG: carbohydrate kinase family protein [Clostridiales bacterium]|nr:carbohydrate kinase family protein [Clostridiales bacterium]
MQKETGNRKAVVAGHICLDIMPEFFNDEAVKIQNLLTPGCLCQTGAADIHIGGCVANTGLGMKILGADVTLMGKIGTDDFGLMVKRQLDQYGAGEGLIVSENESTSYSIVLAPKGVDRMFLHHSGANDTFCASDLNYKTVAEAQMFHFGYPPLMKRFYSDGGEELAEMFRRVKMLGTATSLDMAAVDAHSASGRIDWKELLQKVMPYVDFFVPSAEELAFMIDRERFAEWTERASGKDITTVLQPEDIEPLAEKLISWGAKIVLIKCGVPGMFLAAGQKEDLCRIGGGLGETLASWEGIRHFESSFQPDAVLSGTGAGDTSIAAFLCAVLKGGYSWYECVRYAAAAGACCVEGYDAISGLKTFEEMDARIASGWEKLHR